MAASRGAGGSGTAERRRSPAVTLALSALVLWALILRLFYGLWLADDRSHPDERFSYGNAGAVAASGELRPVSGYYAPATYVPQALVVTAAEALRERGVGDVPAMLEGAALTSAGRAVCRAIQALYGTLLVVAVYALGRRLFDRRTALAAAGLVALSAYYVVGTGLYKPDALAGVFGTLALLASIVASESGRLDRSLLAGSAIGLALSVKFPAGAVAGPLVLSTLVLGRRQPRRWLLLVCAGAAAVVTFLLTNPTWSLNLEAMRTVQAGYAWRAREAGVAHELRQLGGMLWRLSAPGLGLLVAAGYAGLARLATRPAVPPERRVSYWMLLAALPLYAAVYFVGTPHFKAHNFMPVAPAVSLVAAWALVRLLTKVAGAGDSRGRRALAAALGAGLFAAVAWIGHAEIYRRVVPSTLDAALGSLRAPGMTPRSPGLAWVGGAGRTSRSWEGLWQPRAHTVVELAAGSGGPQEAERRRLADGEILLAASAGAAPGDEKAEASSRRSHGRRRRVFRPALFRLRGPALVAVAHPWTLAGVRRLERPAGKPAVDEVLARLPADLAGGEVVSIRVTLPPQATVAPEGAGFEASGRAVPLARAMRGLKGQALLSERFRVRGASRAVRGPRAGVEGAAVRVDLLEWRPRGRRKSGRVRPAETPARIQQGGR